MGKNKFYSEFFIQQKKQQHVGVLFVVGILMLEFLLAEVGVFYPPYWKSISLLSSLILILNLVAFRFKLGKKGYALFALLNGFLWILFLFFRVLNENFNILLIFQVFIGITFITLIMGELRQFTYLALLFVICFTLSLVNVDISEINHVVYLLVGVLGSVFLITSHMFKRKRVKAINLLENILNTSDKILIVSNLKGKVIYVNPYSYNLLKRNGKEEFDNEIWTTLGYDTSDGEVISQCILKCQLHQSKTSIYRKTYSSDGIRRVLEWNDQITNENYLIKVGSDITEIVELNEKEKIAETIIQESNRNIRASISYAKRIQSKMLPSESYLKELLHEVFIYYKPKDIVSGDFYWVHKTDTTVLIAIADCTGHGVPGAMITFVGSAALNDAVSKGILEPSKILIHIDNYVKAALSSTKDSATDGMDIGIVAIDLETKLIEYSGARRPLIVVDHSTGEIKKLNASRKSIGEFLDFDYEQFCTESFSFKNECTIYLFTDGIQDQFGGERGKKMGQKKVLEHIESEYKNSTDQQLINTTELFEKWTHNNTEPQTDDMLLFGMKLSEKYFNQLN